MGAQALQASAVVALVAVVSEEAEEEEAGSGADLLGGRPVHPAAPQPPVRP